MEVKAALPPWPKRQEPQATIRMKRLDVLRIAFSLCCCLALTSNAKEYPALNAVAARPSPLPSGQISSEVPGAAVTTATDLSGNPQGDPKDEVIRQIRALGEHVEEAQLQNFTKVEPDHEQPRTQAQIDGYKAGTVKKTVKQRRPSAARVAAPVADRWYVTRDWGYYKGEKNIVMQLLQEDGVWKMNNVYGTGESVTINFDEATGAVSIAPQQIGESSTYGSPVYMCPVDMDTRQYSTTDPITGTIDDNGNITLSPWGVFLTEGESAGGIFELFTESKWLASNATIKITGSDGAVSEHASLIWQPFDNELRIANFAGNGVTVSATLTSSKKVKISPQQIMVNMMYGPFFCYSLNAEGKVDTKSPIVGTGTDNSISLGGWIVGARALPSQYVALIAAQTEITTTDKITYPAALSVAFDGEGTAASPYLLKTASDVAALSQAVADGEDYQGTTFRLAADIDMSALSGSSYAPIGDAVTPFAGTLDGDGKTISNLTIDTKGFSYGGLFGYLGNTSKVYNLKIAASTLTGTGSYLGLLAGYSGGEITNVEVEGTVDTDALLVGGIVGASSGTIDRSCFKGKVEGAGSIGGIAGNLYGKLTNSYANASVALTNYYDSADSDAGGLVGEAYPVRDVTTECVISDCYFEGTVSDTPGFAYTGGLVGTAVRMKMERCFNVGAIVSTLNRTDGDTGSGGLVGICNEIIATDCYNAGTIIRNGNSEGAGGLAGYISVTYQTAPTFELHGASTFTNCYNSGMVSSVSESEMKGLYGRTFVYNDYDPISEMFFNCYFDRQTSGTKSGVYGKNSVFFTSGQLPEGFSADVWTATANFYPSLKSSAGSAATALATAYAAMAENETVKKLKNTISLNSAESVTWKLFDGETFVDETEALKISGGSVTVKDQYANNILVAMDLDEGIMKYLSLAVVPKVFDGDGTEASPYLIKDKDDFVMLDNAVRQYGQPHEEDFFKMTNDIDFAFAEDFAGVGAGTSMPFGGTFDGDGYYIHNLKIRSVNFDDAGKAVTDGAYYGAGLFNTISSEATVKNVNIASDCDFLFWGESAAVVGHVFGGRVENCRNYAAVTSVSNYAAGVVGAMAANGVVSGCYNAGDVLCGSDGAAGIVGYVASGLVELSQNDGQVKAAFYNAYMKDGTQTTAGGIVGRTYGVIDRCVNNGEVSAYEAVGGIVGDLSAANGNVTNCVNSGMVTAFITTDKRGGIIGDVLSGDLSVSGNYYDASIAINGGAENGTVPGVTGLSTSELVAGKALDGLSKEDFLFVKGFYPGLSAFAYEEASVALRSTYVNFQKGEVRTNLISAVALAKNSRIAWSLSDETVTNFTLENGQLVVTPPTDMTVAENTLVAVYDAKYTKSYELKSIPQNLFDGSGKADDPYQIKTIEDMTLLADFIEASSMDYDGYFFRLMNNLDYTDATFKPIAIGSATFQGDFDGNGKTVSNFTYVDENTKTGKYVGFFGTLGANGSIHDLTLEGSITGHSYVGGFVGKLYGTISGCVNRSTVTASKSSRVGGFVAEAFAGSSVIDSHNEGTVDNPSSNYTGGIIAKMNAGALVDNCYNTGTLTAKSGYIGGIAAYCEGTIRNSRNEADITGSSSIGGIAGSTAKSDTIVNCYNTGNLTGTSSKIGGIFGGSTNKAFHYMKNCYNTGAITGTGDTGGLAGAVEYGIRIEDCYNEGAVTTTKSSNTGGLVGKLRGDAEYETFMIRCYNIAKVEGMGNCIGGLVGTSYDSENWIEDCYNTGDVVGRNESKLLGVAGIAGSGSGTFIRCWNSGNVTSDGYGTGGIAGYASGTVDNCVNLGDVTGGGLGDTKKIYGFAGGIWGYGRSKLYNSYNMGTISGPSNLGGINGAIFSEAVIENCYNAGKIVPTDETVSRCGNIVYMSESSEGYEASISGNYFDAEVSPAFESVDQYAGTGLTTQELMKTAIGESFAVNRAAYPTLAALSGNVRANFAAAYVAFEKEGDNTQNLTGQLYVAVLEGVTWTSSDNISISEDGVAETLKAGDAWVKATAEVDGTTLEKTIPLKIVEASSGVSSLTAGKVCTGKVYYSVSGVEVVAPTVGTLYIVKSIYDDGSITVEKQYYKEK